MSELPKSWRLAKIKDITLPFQTKDPSSDPEKAFTYIDIGSIDNEIQEIVTPKNILGRDAPSRARRLVQAGDVLFSTVRTYLKNIAIVPANLHGSMTSTGIAVLRPTSAIDSRYLFNWVRSPEFLARITPQMDGTLYPAVTDKDVLNQVIPLPPLDEQRRIVAKLDALFARSKAARAELARVPRLVERAKQAVLTKAFSGELTRKWRESKIATLSWDEKSLGELAEIGTGSTPKRGDARYYKGGTIPWVTSAVVNDPLVERAEEMITQVALDETNCKVFPAGTILVAMYGEGQTRGRVSVLGIDAATNQALAAVRVRDLGSISHSFILWFLRSNYLELRQKAAGGVQPNLNLGIIKAIPIPVPSIAEQAEIVRRIEAAFARIERMAGEAARAAALLDRLEQATLARAFRGELLQ
jgi:type I restriction enzyme S subunit